MEVALPHAGPGCGIVRKTHSVCWPDVAEDDKSRFCIVLCLSE